MSSTIAGGSLKVFNKCSKDLYRDCLRLVKHIAGKSKKADTIKFILSKEFRKHAQIVDEDVIATLKANAVRGLANYLMIEASSKDKRLKDLSKTYTNKVTESLKNITFKDKEENT